MYKYKYKVHIISAFQEGHLAKDCPDGDKKTCYRCSGKGHIAMDCPSSQRELDRCGILLEKSFKISHFFLTSIQSQEEGRCWWGQGWSGKNFLVILHNFPTNCFPGHRRRCWGPVEFRRGASFGRDPWNPFLYPGFCHFVVRSESTRNCCSLLWSTTAADWLKLRN